MPLKNICNDVIKKQLDILENDNYLEGIVIFGNDIDNTIAKNTYINILAIVEESKSISQKNLVIKEEKIHLHIQYMTLEELRYYINNNIENIMYKNKLDGQIVYDKNDNIKNIVEMLEKKRRENKKVCLLKEFGSLINNFNDSKRLLKCDKFYDGFKHVIDAMNNWGNLVLIENNMIISEESWESVKKLDIGVYKLYEELLSSSEPIEDKIKLIHLVFENTITIKLNKYAGLLMDIFKNNKVLSLEEVLNDKRINKFDLEQYLEPLFKEYTNRNVFKETIKSVQLNDGISVQEVYYSIK